jgi:hypothetical protein
MRWPLRNAGRAAKFLLDCCLKVQLIGHIPTYFILYSHASNFNYNFKNRHKLKTRVTSIFWLAYNDVVCMECLFEWSKFTAPWLSHAANVAQLCLLLFVLLPTEDKSFFEKRKSTLCARVARFFLGQCTKAGEKHTKWLQNYSMPIKYTKGT